MLHFFFLCSTCSTFLLSCHSDSQSENCSKVSHSFADDGGKTPSGITSKSLPSTSNTCNGTCCIAGIVTQPTDRELHSQTELIYGSGKNVQKQCFLPS